MRFSLLRSFGSGIALYACMYLAFALIAAYGYAGTSTARIAMLFVLLSTTLIATRTIAHLGKVDRVPYVLSWLIVIGVLDVAFAAASDSWVVFSDPNLWVGYGLVAITPFVAPASRFLAPPASLS